MFLLNLQPYQGMERFHHPGKSPGAPSHPVPFFPGNNESDFSQRTFVCSRTSYEWNHRVCAPSCLASGENEEVLAKCERMPDMALATFVLIFHWSFTVILHRMWYCSCTAEDDAEVQRNETPCLWSQIWEGAEPEFRFGSFGLHRLLFL